MHLRPVNGFQVTNGLPTGTVSARATDSAAADQRAPDTWSDMERAIPDHVRVSTDPRWRVDSLRLDTDGFTVAAAKRWASIDGRLRLRLLNNVWCVRCRRGGSIVNYTGRMEQQDLILEGECAKCGGSVARVIEGPDE